MFSTTRSHDANGSTRSVVGQIVGALALVCALTFANGCTLLSDNLERAAKAAGKVVTAYCENVTVAEVREEIATAVNAKAAPHKVEVTCADEVAAPPSAWNWDEVFDYFRAPIIWIERAPIFFPENA